MRLRISVVDYAPEELYEQLPLEAELVREIPGSDRPDYWIARLVAPVLWRGGDTDTLVTHLVLCARWQGTAIEAGMHDLPVGIAYVRDSSVLEDKLLDFGKCAYVAIGIAEDVGA